MVAPLMLCVDPRNYTAGWKGTARDPVSGAQKNPESLSKTKKILERVWPISKPKWNP